MWIGTSAGLYLLDKFSGKIPQHRYACGIYAYPCLVSGRRWSVVYRYQWFRLVLYNPEEEAFAQYYTDNCALISNNIYTILPKPDGDLLFSTENGIVHFSPRRMSFNNWTREQGLMSVCFNPVPVFCIVAVVLSWEVMMGSLVSFGYAHTGPNLFSDVA